MRPKYKIHSYMVMVENMYWSRDIHAWIAIQGASARGSAWGDGRCFKTIAAARRHIAVPNSFWNAGQPHEDCILNSRHRRTPNPHRPVPRKRTGFRGATMRTYLVTIDPSIPSTVPYTDCKWSGAGNTRKLRVPCGLERYAEKQLDRDDRVVEYDVPLQIDAHTMDGGRVVAIDGNRVEVSYYGGVSMWLLRRHVQTLPTFVLATE